MKRSNEALVGATVLGAFAVVAAGSLWLSQLHVGGGEQIRTARFRIIGGLQSGNPVVMRGVRIGRVKDISLAPDNWVIVSLSLRLRPGAAIPPHPAAIISSTTLFGDWGVGIYAQADLPDDPEVRRQIAEAAPPAAAPRRPGTPEAEVWPGATLPDIGQLTAQAGRIAGDIASIAGRVENTFDTSTARRIQSAFRDLSNLSNRMAVIVRGQETTLTTIGRHLDTGTTSLSRSALALERTLRRADSATSGEQLQRILSHADTVSTDMRQVAANLRSVTEAAAAQQQALGRIIANTDSVLARLWAGEGTLGRLSRDTALYAQSVQAVLDLRRLLDDVQRNPRKYFSFSVF